MSDDVTSDATDELSEPKVGDEAPEGLDERSDLERERDEYLATLQRLQADFENYRKRVVRNADDAATRAVGALVVTLLPVLDAFDYAQTHFADATSHEAVALSQARGVLLAALEREGLERVDEVTVTFDPTVHDAVAHEALGDGEIDTGPLVAEVMRAGYRWKGVTLRPAMVRVRG